MVTATRGTTQTFLDVCNQTPGGHAFVRELLSRVGDKWSIYVVSTLARGTMRFTELQNAIPGISHRMLTVTLRSLTTDGLIRREAFGEVLPRVEYSLTPMGETLLEPVLALIAWAGEHQEAIESHRDGTAATPVS